LAPDWSLARISRSLARPFRAVILALSIHVLFAAMFGISLQFEPQIVKITLVEPVQAVVIDQVAIEREKIRKADLQRQREEEVRRQAEKKKAERLEVKRQADLKKRQEVERKRKQEEKKVKEAEAKRKVEAKQQEEIKRKQEEKKMKEAEADRQAEEKKKREAEEKKKREAEAKHQAEEKRKKEAEAKRQAEEKKQKEAEARRKAEEEKERQAEEKKQKEAEARRKAEEKKERQAEEAKRQLINNCSSALGALVSEIENKVRNNWAYAGDATGLEVIISVKVTRDGEVASANEWRSSGDSIFDRSAVNALRKASPLPFPDDPRCYEHIKEFNFIFTPDG
jgi:colicin import membrane protein